MQGNLDNVVIIDLDSDGFDDVITIDVPEPLRQKFCGSSVHKDGESFPIPCIISLDDDEICDYVDNHEVNVDENVGLDSDYMDFSNKTSPASDFMRKSEDADVDDCQVVFEKRPAFKLSKCNKTYNKDSSSRNRYGLNFESETESGSSKSDSSDCEVVEISCRELHEQWVKAFQKRKLNTDYKGPLSPQDKASPCSSHSDAHPNVRVENSTRQKIDSSSNNVNSHDANSSNFTATRDGFVGGSLSPGMEYPFAESYWKVQQEPFSRRSKQESRKNTGSHKKADVQFGRERCMGDINFWFDECQTENGYGTRFQNNREGPLGPHSSWIRDRDIKQCLKTRSHVQHSEQSITGGCSFPNSQPNLNLNSEYEGSHVHNKDAFLGKHSINPSRVVSMEKNENFTPVTSIYDACSNEAQRQNVGSKGKDRLVAGSSCYAEGQKPVTSSFYNLSISDGKDPLDALSPVQRDIINEREKLKETDEFKRAVEEEWAARQKELNFQAEEAKRLRKRKKAESLRILALEKRLKQRVEEVRETQRKDEENLNMKENLRTEVRKELYQLENACIDMASLLRGLGIQVGGGFHPLTQEVHAAYKRALLKFHPDRASRTDIRQQVEAEEKFKLISRMKQKFLSTSCY
ncbi:conserved hypothetical protein [Ricinus communis]|uniref:J domain-containing protein n=1 Tax=Ricinus communis TaxID=3988 RepID=B9RE95_RICCO|nr:conserved hypothetical protein [Ricinus communis]